MGSMSAVRGGARARSLVWVGVWMGWTSVVLVLAPVGEAAQGDVARQPDGTGTSSRTAPPTVRSIRSEGSSG
jgi:hypothetical protein